MQIKPLIDSPGSNNKKFEDREFPMTPKNFATIREVAAEFTGIVLTDHKREMVYSRLARRIRQLGLRDFNDYCSLLCQPTHAEHSEFINAITTNLTAFFREPHHFEQLKAEIIPELCRKNAASRKLRIWSAGCSTGMEPYSLAITLRESHIARNWDVKILATDLDSKVLATAARGEYSLDKLEGVNEERFKKWFLKSRHGGQVRVKDTIKELIRFNRLNLLEEWPMKGKFDIIFCRNVVIYFNKDTQRKLFDRYAEIMNDGGYLFIGHSESLNTVTNRFEGLGKTAYRKIQ